MCKLSLKPGACAALNGNFIWRARSVSGSIRQLARRANSQTVAKLLFCQFWRVMNDNEQEERKKKREMTGKDAKDVSHLRNLATWQLGNLATSHLWVIAACLSSGDSTHWSVMNDQGKRRRRWETEWLDAFLRASFSRRFQQTFLGASFVLIWFIIYPSFGFCFCFHFHTPAHKKVKGISSIGSGPTAVGTASWMVIDEVSGSHRARRKAIFFFWFRQMFSGW